MGEVVSDRHELLVAKDFVHPAIEITHLSAVLVCFWLVCACWGLLPLPLFLSPPGLPAPNDAGFASLLALCTLVAYPMGIWMMEHQLNNIFYRWTKEQRLKRAFERRMLTAIAMWMVGFWIYLILLGAVTAVKMND